MTHPPANPASEVAKVEPGTWVVAVQVSQNNGATTAHSMALCRRENCTEAEALKEALEATQKLKPGFSVDQWLTTFVAAHLLTQAQAPAPTCNDSVQVVGAGQEEMNDART